MIKNSSEEPRVIEYLKTSPTRAELVELIARMVTMPQESKQPAQWPAVWWSLFVIVEN